ncbi:sensor histidine kinase [Peribacillus tepidiphilus]|uniref:sensor histidine kinase n=1 Tax=Peribacillus tepidiphilus TaxID=2652445 RepID=UPI0035B53C0D
MRLNRLTLAQKLWLTVTVTVFITVLFTYLLSQFFYEKLYVDNVTSNLLIQAELLANDYEGGPISDSFKEKVDWYNEKNIAEIFAVSNPRELSACLPFGIDYDTLISSDEREKLLKGEPVKKEGYEERFDRNIVAIIYPLLDDERLEGILYVYLPLASIKDLMKDFTTFWMIASFLFIVVSIFLGTLWINRLIRPLKEMEAAAHSVSQGDFSQRVEVTTVDEIGQLAKAFNEMAAAIQKEDESKREFLADISHELRTPLSYVKGYVQAILDGIVKDEHEQRKYLGLIARETKRLQDLVQDLLDLTKLESNSFEMEEAPVAFAQLIEDILVKYKLRFQEKDITLAFNLDPDPIIMGDERRLEQILQNILENAYRYTPNGGKITVELTSQDDHCIVTITDNGIGISEEHIQKITERFYRVNKARSRVDGGTGLGLSIVEKLMKMHNGKMKITSKIGEGTQVQLIFPILSEI